MSDAFVAQLVDLISQTDAGVAVGHNLFQHFNALTQPAVGGFHYSPAIQSPKILFRI